MRSITLFSLLVIAFSATAATDTCGWEGTDTVLGTYGDIIATIATDPVYSGSQSLKLEDDQASGTPQAFVAWVTGLSDGDQVYASFYRYDVTPSAAPSCRIWAHWNDDPADISVYSGSAGGLDDYGPGTGWDLAEYTWTVESGHTGLVVEVRTYSSPGDIVFIDDLTVTAPETATIIVPEDGTALSRNSWAAIKATF